MKTYTQWVIAALFTIQPSYAACDLPMFGGARLFPAANQPEIPALGDFSNDGAIDVAVLNVSGSVSILLGNGDGTFRTGANYPITNPFYAVTGDFNGDGVPDLAIAANYQVIG
jgi:hypothetical protein